MMVYIYFKIGRKETRSLSKQNSVIASRQIIEQNVFDRTQNMWQNDCIYFHDL